MLLVMVVAGIVAGVVLPGPVIRSGRAVTVLLAVVVVTVLACVAAGRAARAGDRADRGGDASGWRCSALCRSS